MATGRVGIRPYSGSTTTTTTALSYDVDAQAFITAAALTDTGQKTAVNDLVLDLKAAGVWTKMKALYPMIGGTATTHKFNLKDPRDLDAAYRLSFAGGWTHSATGALPNGSNAYADTNLICSSALTTMNQHISYYSRTNNTSDAYIDCGVQDDISPSIGRNLFVNFGSTSIYQAQCLDANRISVADTNSLGLRMVSRLSSTNLRAFRNGVNVGTNTTSSTSGLTGIKTYLGAFNYRSGTGVFRTYYGIRECAFSSIGDGLTDLESNLFYQIVEKYQYALGRNVNATQSFYFNRNYSNETNTFIFNGGITDTTQQSAINTLVTTLKTANIWTKMKAVYPMVGGTATSHKFNLVNPVDTDAAFRLVFNGGWTHSATGALPNGSNAYADTKLTPSTVLTSMNAHISYYSRTNITNIVSDNGALDVQGSYKSMLMQYYNTPNTPYYDLQTNGVNYISASATNSLGLMLASRTSSSMFKAYRDANLVGTNTAVSTNQLPGINIYWGAFNYRNASGILSNYYGLRQCAFASIGDGLTDADALTLYNAVQAFQTTLNRQV